MIDFEEEQTSRKLRYRMKRFVDCTCTVWLLSICGGDSPRLALTSLCLYARVCPAMYNRWSYCKDIMFRLVDLQNTSTRLFGGVASPEAARWHGSPRGAVAGDRWPSRARTESERG